jgi:hypothetical protein
MTRPTNETKSRAKRVGRPAPTLQGWIDRGYGPVEPLTPAKERRHFDAVAQATGPGRDPVVAFIKLAIDGVPTVGLRGTLLTLSSLEENEEDSTNADELVEYGRSSPRLEPFLRPLRAAAKKASTQDYEAADMAAEPGLSEAILGSALLPVGQATVGEPIDPLEVVDSIRLMNAAWGMESDEVDSEYADFHVRLLMASADYVRAAGDWLKTATPQDLCRAVQAAERLIDALAIIDISFKDRGEEARWRAIGQVAPLSPQILSMLTAIYDACLPLLRPEDLTERQVRVGDAIASARHRVKPADD